MPPKSQPIDVRVGSVWVEDDERFQNRYVKVVELTRKPSPRNAGFVPAARLASCTKDGEPTAVKQTTLASVSRFGKSGGYRLVKDI